MIDFKRKPNESDEELIFRVCSSKTPAETWQFIADGLNEEMGTQYNESKFRKQYATFQRMFDAVGHKFIDNEHLEEIEQKQKELYKQQVKYQDVMRQHRATLRDEARIEVLVDAIKDSVAMMPLYRIENNYGCCVGENEAVLCISDWHTGSYVRNFYNNYDLKIQEDRLKKLTEKTIQYCIRNNVSKLNVCNLNDLIEGNIHVTTRIESEINVIQQVMQCAEYISKLLVDLNNEIPTVVYRSVLDNHARVNNKKEHIEKENFAKLVDWYLIERLKHTNVIIESNKIDDNIGYFKLDNGKNFMFEHGHLGSINSKFQELAFSTNIIPDYIAIGHVHHVTTKEFQGKKMFVCGTLKGADEYSVSKRLFSKPSQTMIVFEEDEDIRIDINF
jgi:hypothetical protein